MTISIHFGKFSLAAVIGVLTFSVGACKQGMQNSTPSATITNDKGDISTVDLSTFVATKGECNLDGGYEVAAKGNMRYSRAVFEASGKTLMVRNFDEPKLPLASIVTEYEMGLLVSYTGGLYRNLNAWLRGDKEKIGENERNVSDAEWSRKALCMASAINKMARYQGAFNRLIAYRGAALDSSLVKERYQKGKIITERSFQSYSFDQKVAIGYASPANNQGKTSVLFVLKGSGSVGFNIEPISSFPEEKELLVNADIKYCVGEVVQKKVGSLVPDSTLDSALKEAAITVVSLSVGLGGGCTAN